MIEVAMVQADDGLR